METEIIHTVASTDGEIEARVGMYAVNGVTVYVVIVWDIEADKSYGYASRRYTDRAAAIAHAETING